MVVNTIYGYNSAGRVGPSGTSLIFPLDLYEVSTMVPGMTSSSRQITLNDLATDCPQSEPAEVIATMAPGGPCDPILVAPDKVRSWASPCGACGAFGLFDPPYAIPALGGPLVPVPVTTTMVAPPQPETTTTTTPNGPEPVSTSTTTTPPAVAATSTALAPTAGTSTTAETSTSAAGAPTASQTCVCTCSHGKTTVTVTGGLPQSTSNPGSTAAPSAKGAATKVMMDDGLVCLVLGVLISMCLL